MASVWMILVFLLTICLGQFDIKYSGENEMFIFHLPQDEILSDLQRFVHQGKNGPVFDNSESSCKLWTSLENSENNNLGRLFSTFEIFISTSCTWMYKINHCSFAYSDHLKFFGMQIITSASVSAINCTNAWQRALWSCHGLC